MVTSMKVFTFKRQYHPDPEVPKWFMMYLGQTVRLVRMDGCMAHIRGEVKMALVTGFVKRSLYDGNAGGRLTKMVQLKLDDGSVIERVAEPSEWFQVDGALEHHY
jgi:hypothetical protein